MAFRKLNGLFKSAYEPDNLLKTNVVASGLLLLIGDTIQQSIELYRGVHEKGSYDIPRSSRMLAIGLFHGAPRHFFYVRLEKSIPGTSLKCAAKKVFFDQAVLSVFVDTTFLFGMALLEGKGPIASLENLKDKFPRVYLYDNLLWPPVQMINFTIVPSKYRVLYVSVCNCVWNTILSFSHHADS